MNEHIRLLDCTLRDGGHVIGGKFGENTIKNVIKKLVEAKIDIIEVGFLWESITDKDTARYYTIEDVKKILPEDRGVSSFSLMADFIDLEHLEPCDGTIEYIRLSFKRHRLQWGLSTAKILMDKGYKCFINPVNCNVYSDEEYLEVLNKVNELHPYGFSMVDTFGVMRKSDLSAKYYLVENNLLKDITIGMHVHENLGLAYSLAQHFTEIASPTRKIVVDGSLLGMGRVPGNLCIEQFMDHLNRQYGKQYATEPAYDAIDDFIAPIKAKTGWGYSIPYALSAKFNLHRTYAEYLLGKKRLKTKDIQRILSLVDRKESELFNEQYIESLYKDYMNVEYDSERDFKKLGDELTQKQVFVIAPGASIQEQKKVINEYVDTQNCFTIAINFIPDFIDTNFMFCTNFKRFDDISDNIKEEKIIVTSNLMQEEGKKDYIISYNDLVYFDEVYCDDSTLMLLNLLKYIGIRKVVLAGFDGRYENKLHFYNEEFARNSQNKQSNEVVNSILRHSFKDMEICTLTDSAYTELQKI